MTDQSSLRGKASWPGDDVSVRKCWVDSTLLFDFKGTLKSNNRLRRRARQEVTYFLALDIFPRGICARGGNENRPVLKSSYRDTSKAVGALISTGGMRGRDGSPRSLVAISQCSAWGRTNHVQESFQSFYIFPLQEINYEIVKQINEILCFWRRMLNLETI